MGDFGGMKKRDYEYSDYSYQSDFWQCMAQKFPDWFVEEKPEDDPQPPPPKDDRPGDKPGERPDDRPGKGDRKSKRGHDSAKLQNRRRALLNALKHL